VNVQTLREWQRKKYLPLPDTGGWQRYRIQQILLVSTMDYLLKTDLSHDLASRIAAFSFPTLMAFMSKNSVEIPIFYLLVSINPNEELSFDLIEDLKNVSGVLLAQSGQSRFYTTRLLIDFKDIYQSTFESLKEHTVHDGPRMFWKSESDLDK
jgi:hypothetical protein